MQHKAVFQVILCCALMHMSAIGSNTILYHTADKDAVLSYLVSQGVAYLLYPLLGWLADVYFTRYKFVQASFITIIVATILMIITTSLSLKFCDVRLALYFEGISLLVGIIAIGLFESTAIQFGMDQMLEASSDKLSTFIHWYYWSSKFGQSVLFFADC